MVKAAKSWRDDFPPDGPGEEAPLADRQRFVRCRHQAIIDEAKRRLGVVLNYVPSPYREDEKREKAGAPTTEAIFELGQWTQNAKADQSVLQNQTRMLKCGAAPESGVSIEDIDAVASALCKRLGLSWTSKSKPTAKVLVSADDPCPSFDAEPALKLAYFKKAWGQAGRYANLLQKLALSDDRLMRDAVRFAGQLLTVWQHGLRDLSVLAGVTKTSKDFAKASKAAIDDLEEECLARQKTARVSDADKIRVETVAGVVADVEDARKGLPAAYLRLVGFAQVTEKARMPFELTPAHWEMLNSRLAHLRCKGCGAWHQQEWVPQYDPVTEKHEVPKLKCPACGLEDCAGPQNHRIAAPRGMGKTELVARCCGVLDYALLLYRGYRGRYQLIGSNKTEAKLRLGKRVAIMRLPGHRLAFPMAVPAAKKAGAESVLMRGEDSPSLACCGIESLAPGIHADIIDCDDVVNEKNTITHPGLVEMVQSKVVNVIDYSMKKNTILTWVTTVWKSNDADDRLERYALAHPELWTNCVVAVTGAPPVGDAPGTFISPWPNMWSPAELDAMYRKDPCAFRRAMMMQRVTDEDLVFHTVGYWMYDNENLVDKIGACECQDYVLVSRAQMESWPKVLGCDLAFTGTDKETKNRSMTSFNITAIDPDTKRKFVLYTSLAYIKPGKHEDEIVRLVSEWHVSMVAIEKDKTVTELCESLRAKLSVPVEEYSPAALGSKEYRKLPLAGWFNNGQAFVHGVIYYSGGKGRGQPTLMAHDLHKNLREHLLAFPTSLPDDLDALEIASRTAESYWGGTPLNRQGAPVGKSYNELQEWRDNHYRDAPANANEHGENDEGDGALLDAIDSENEVLLSALMN